jgi:hypothetical protein
MVQLYNDSEQWIRRDVKGCATDETLGFKLVLITNLMHNFFIL